MTSFNSERFYLLFHRSIYYFNINLKVIVYLQLNFKLTNLPIRLHNLLQYIMYNLSSLSA